MPTYVPTLDEALDACTPMMVNVEIKSAPREPDYDPSQQLAAMVAALLVSRADASRMLVSSFDMATIDAVRHIAPSLRTGFLCTMPKPDATTAVADVARRGHVAIHPLHLAVNGELVAAAHAVGLEVNVWTVDDPARMLELAAWGADAVITNVPDIAISTLAGLGSDQP